MKWGCSTITATQGVRRSNPTKLAIGEPTRSHSTSSATHIRVIARQRKRLHPVTDGLIDERDSPPKETLMVEAATSR